MLAATMKELGVDLLNCMAMFPNADTAFEHIAEAVQGEMDRVRNEAEQYLPQMRHCTRCRADAVGLLDHDRTDEMRGCGAGGYRLVEVRQAPGQGGGPRRWMCLARLLSDCRAVLVNDLGESPWKILTGKGVRPVPMAGFIEQGLEAVYSGKGLHTLQGRVRKCSTKGACAGAGSGCG
jgi:nitrogen fixation protein NifB